MSKYVYQFTGAPKAGKTSVINALTSRWGMDQRNMEELHGEDVVRLGGQVAARPRKVIGIINPTMPESSVITGWAKCDVLVPLADDLNQTVDLIHSIMLHFESQAVRDELNRKTRLFVDMDGTLCEWKSSSQEEDLFSRGWFLDMKPIANVVQAVSKIVECRQVEVFIMTAVMDESKYAKEEKILWLQEHLPDIDLDHVIFVPYGKPKHEFAPGGIRSSDILLDDYSRNLHEWSMYGIGLKAKTKNNGTKGTWIGDSIRADWAPEVICEHIAALIKRAAGK